MSIYETEDLYSVGPIDIEVRIWHEDAYGMRAEPLRYKVNDTWHPMGISEARDDLVKALVAAEYDEHQLDCIRDDDPAFEGLPYDEPEVSQERFQHMRI